jgi:hypothetical protein
MVSLSQNADAAFFMRSCECTRHFKGFSAYMFAGFSNAGACCCNALHGMLCSSACRMRAAAKVLITRIAALVSPATNLQDST